MSSTLPAGIEAFIAGFPADVQNVLRTVRAAIRRNAPEAEEKISYGMGTFAIGGVKRWRTTLHEQ